MDPSSLISHDVASLVQTCSRADSFVVLILHPSSFIPHSSFFFVRLGGNGVSFDIDRDELQCRWRRRTLHRRWTIAAQDLDQDLATRDDLLHTCPIFVLIMHNDVERREIRLNSLEEPIRLLQAPRTTGSESKLVHEQATDQTQLKSTHILEQILQSQALPKLDRRHLHVVVFRR